MWTGEESMEKFEQAFKLAEYGLNLKKEQLDICKVHFLDIEIELNKGNLKTAVYRKPTYEPVIIPSWSWDPIRYKRSAFNYFFRRAILYTTDDEKLREEINYIISMGEKHGYS